MSSPRRATAVLLLVLLGSALAGCLSPGAAPSPAEAPPATTSSGHGEDPAAAADLERIAELPACGIVVWGRPGLAASAASTARGLLLLGSAEAPAERLTVMVWRGSADEMAEAFESGGAAWTAAVPGWARLVSSERIPIPGEEGEERRFVFEGTDGERNVTAWVRVLPHGNATLVAAAHAPTDEGPTDPLLEAWRGVRREGAPTEACASTAEAAPAGMSSEPDAAGRVLYRAREDAWALRHPANWTVAPLGDSGLEMLFASPLEDGGWDDFRESVMVILRAPVPEGGLDEMEDELLRQLREKFPDFNLTLRARTLLDGAPAIRLESTETHVGRELRSIRVVGIQGDRLALLEAQIEPFFGDPQENDVESVLASFRWSVPPAEGDAP